MKSFGNQRGNSCSSYSGARLPLEIAAENISIFVNENPTNKPEAYCRMVNSYETVKFESDRAQPKDTIGKLERNNIVQEK